MNEEKKEKKGRVKNEERLVIKDSILEPYEIRTDAYNYVLFDTTKSDSQAPQGYFNDVRGCIRQLIRIKIRDVKQTITLKEYLYNLTEEHKKFDKLLTDNKL